MDLRYERIYGYLQDDLSRGRPLVGLVLDLPAATPEERPAFRGVLAPDAPLLGQRILTLIPDPRPVAPPFLAHFLVPDEQITDVLLGQSGLDRRLAGCCRLDRPPAECRITRLKRHRVGATRYDKIAVRYEATVLLTAINEWL
ncbi:hypothetical protein [Streptomyces bobili]|uniref:hypothetical protein n=1 Tax=Streptomyces bobili TaxID=67280 RepID=UPI0034121AAE